MKAITLIIPFCFLLFSYSNIMGGDFIDNGIGTITDENTDLMWQQGEGGSMIWEDAIEYCENLSLAGYSDWRLPNIKELESIVDDKLYNPSIDNNFFPGVHALSYWSSTSSHNPEYAWHIYFFYGHIYDNNKAENNFYVRCVRGGN